MVIEKKVGNFLKGGVYDEIADIEASINQIPFLPIHIRDPGICHLHPTESDVLNIYYLFHLSQSLKNLIFGINLAV
jgi:hypothetical protein